MSRPSTIREFLAADGPPRVIAHRGHSGAAPENTMAAFALAIEAGADMMEFDVTLSADGRAVVLHDDTLDRTTNGTGPAMALPFAELRRLDAGSWFSRRFSAERIPELGEVLRLAKGRILVNVEIKSEAAGAPGGLEERVVEAIRAEGMEKLAILSSFNPLALFRCREAGPEIARAVLYNPGLESRRTPAELLEELGADCFNCSSAEFTPALAEACRRAGRPVAVYTVDDPITMRRVLDQGARAVFTDHPPMMRVMID